MNDHLLTKVNYVLHQFHLESICGFGIGDHKYSKAYLKLVHLSPLTEADHLARSCLALNPYTKCVLCSYEKEGWPAKWPHMDRPPGLGSGNSQLCSQIWHHILGTHFGYYNISALRYFRGLGPS